MGHQAADTSLRMSRAEFRRWADAQPRGRYARVDGVVVRMAAERAAHMRVKMRVWRTFDRALPAAGLPCEAMGDGMTVEVDDDTDYEADALINGGPRLADDEIAAPNPVVVVEVPSLRHYLVVRADRRAVVQHQRRGDGGIETRVLAAGSITLDPPGIGFALEEFYED
ncbi:MAG TPA: Uma2 family endonuclease [Acetobacteraceae bacterium]